MEFKTHKSMLNWVEKKHNVTQHICRQSKQVFGERKKYVYILHFLWRNAFKNSKKINKSRF